MHIGSNHLVALLIPLALSFLAAFFMINLLSVFVAGKLAPQPAFYFVPVTGNFSLAEPGKLLNVVRPAGAVASDPFHPSSCVHLLHL